MGSIKEFFRRKGHLDFKGGNVSVYPMYPLSYTSGLANVHIPLATALICGFSIAFACIPGKHLRFSFLATLQPCSQLICLKLILFTLGFSAGFVLIYSHNHTEFLTLTPSPMVIDSSLGFEFPFVHPWKRSLSDTQQRCIFGSKLFTLQAFCTCDWNTSGISVGVHFFTKLETHDLPLCRKMTLPTRIF